MDPLAQQTPQGHGSSAKGTASEMKEFYLPTQIVTGSGCFATLGKHVAPHGRRAMLVCGSKSLRASGHLEQALETLRAAEIVTTLYDAVSGEPTLDLVQEGLDQARSAQVQVVIGVGGGSAMDTAKAIAGLYSHPGKVIEYFGGRPISRGGLPWIAVPTTAGTGAEVTKNAVLSSSQRQLKASLRHDDWFAASALIDPTLTLTAAPELTAASGSDALTQAIESYTSIGASPITDALAADAIVRIGRSLERAHLNGHDEPARADMLYGSTLAGMALANARLGGVHGMAHPLGFRYHIPHGVVCGLLLSHTMAYSIDYAVPKYAQVARLLGLETQGTDDRTAAERAVERVGEIVSAVNLPLHLSHFGVRVDDLDSIAQESLPSGSLKHNPRPLSADDVKAILTAAL